MHQRVNDLALAHVHSSPCRWVDACSLLVNAGSIGWQCTCSINRPKNCLSCWFNVFAAAQQFYQMDKNHLRVAGANTESISDFGAKAGVNLLAEAWLKVWSIWKQFSWLGPIVGPSRLNNTVSLQFAKNAIIHLSKKACPKILVFNRGELCENWMHRESV